MLRLGNTAKPTSGLWVAPFPCESGGSPRAAENVQGPTVNLETLFSVLIVDVLEQCKRNTRITSSIPKGKRRIFMRSVELLGENLENDDRDSKW